MKLRFLTSTPLNIRHGSGTFVGITVLAAALERLGHTVAIEHPARSLPVYTVQRALFNWSLSAECDADVTIGFDMDGYRIAGRGRRHVASLKGVIADEVRFESGLTHATMAWQADRERIHVRRADRVIVTSEYSAQQAQSLYGLKERPRIVPELLDVAAWRKLLQMNPAPKPDRFTVLSVGRFYPRKRIHVLLRAAALLRDAGFHFRIVGGGPCADELQRLWKELRLEETVSFLGDVTRAQLAAEYNCCDAFCLPSVQEGFGIVLLEAMAAGKAIVAARAGAAPEVVPHAELVEPDSPEALAAGLLAVAQSDSHRAGIAAAGADRVEQFDAARVAQAFLAAVL